MKKFVLAGAAAAAVIAGGVAATGALANTPAAVKQVAGDFWAGVHWDDDDDDRGVRGPIPRPDEAALRKAGVVRITEVERDDGQIEVEGYDAQGRELDVTMDAKGQKVLRVEHDRD